MTHKLGICITKSPYQTVGTICCRCRSCFWELLFRAIPLSCRGFGGFYGHCKRTDVQSGIVPPTSAQVVGVGERLHLGRLGTLLDCEQRQNCQGFLPKQKILHHHMCSKCNCHVQGLSLFWITNAAAPPPHGELDEEDLVATCECAPAISLYTPTACAVHRSSFQTAPNGNKGGTQRSRQL